MAHPTAFLYMCVMGIYLASWTYWLLIKNDMWSVLGKFLGIKALVPYENNIHMSSTLYMVFNIINIVLTNWCKGDYIYISWILVNQRPHNIKLPINVFRIDSQYSKKKSRKHSQWTIYLSISLFLYYIKWTATRFFLQLPLLVNMDSSVTNQSYLSKYSLHMTLIIRFQYCHW